MSTHTEHHDVVSAAALRDWPLPEPAGSKRSRGRVLVVGGSPSTPGAAMLAGVSALRVGAGVLAMAVAASAAPAVAAAVPEAAVTGLPALDGDAHDDTLEGALSGCDTVLVGPGLDDPHAAERVLRAVLAAVDGSVPLVLDAFALGVLATLDDHDAVAGRAVLTPNPSEAARLLGVDDVTDREELEVTAEIVTRYGVVVSYESTVGAPDGRSWTVPSGHAGLGTSGSGDVLAGAVAGLLARGADLAQAACWGTFLHATAGDRLASRVGRLGFLARELADELPFALVQTEA